MLMEPGVAMTVKTTDGSQDEKRLLVIDERDDEVEDSDTNQTKCVAKVRRDEVSDSASLLREPSLDAMMVGVDKADRWSLIVAVVTFGGLLLLGLWIIFRHRIP